MSAPIPDNGTRRHAHSCQGWNALHNGGAVLALFLYTGFIRAMPHDLKEAAFVDGVGLCWTDWSIMMPVPVLSVTPMIIFYLFMQRHIVAGLAPGSLRG